MKGLEKITARIEQDSHAEIEAVLRQADEAAAAVRSQYADEAAAASAKADGEAARAARERLERLESAARMDAKKLLLATKQDCIQAAFDRALADLLALPEEEYAALLARIAVGASQSGREELIFSPADRERVGAKVVAEANRLRSGTVLPFEQSAKAPEDLEGRVKDTLKGVGNAVAAAVGQLRTGTAFTLSDETREMSGGLILKDGSIEINCAFETQLRFLRESMAGQVADILFS